MKHYLDTAEQAARAAGKLLRDNFRQRQRVNAVTAHDVVSVDQGFNARNRGHVSAHDDGRTGRKPTRHPAHLAHLADVHDDGRDADDLVVMVG